MKPDFTYLSQPPKRYTFEQLQLKNYVENHCVEPVLNLFAGKTKLSVKEIRVDLDPEMPADFHVNAIQFLKEWDGEKFGTVILDPPYNLRKSREKYGNRYIGSLTKIKNEIPRILQLGGRVISLGYDSVGMAQCRGFKKIAVCLICHGGDHNDTICLVEQMYQMPISHFLMSQSCSKAGV